MSADDVVAAVGPSVQRYLTQPDLTQPDLTQPDLTQPNVTQPAGQLPG
jgi:hypothetical protein